MCADIFSAFILLIYRVIIDCNVLLMFVDLFYGAVRQLFVFGI